MLGLRPVKRHNLWAFVSWSIENQKQARAGLMLAALNLAVAWYEFQEGLNSKGLCELEGVMYGLSLAAPGCCFLELEPVQIQAALWLLRLGQVADSESWTLGGDCLDVSLFGLWLEGCGVDLSK